MSPKTTLNGHWQLLDIEVSGELMPIKKLKSLGKVGWKLYCVEKETWKRPGGFEAKCKQKEYTHFLYCFIRPSNYEEMDCKPSYDYKEIVIFHSMYKEDALNYELTGWKKVASCDHLREKEAGIVVDGGVSRIVCPCFVHYYQKQITYC